MMGTNIRANVNVVNMSSTSGRRETYHHGALRAALLEGAREMLSERGPVGFSLNALARRLGVSTAAPYRHFADRDALLDALADEGYLVFGAALEAAVAAGDDPRDRILRIGVAYLQFAADHPAVFEIMFRDRQGRPHEVGPPTFQPVVDTVEEAREAGVLPSELSTLVLSRNIWATAHGLAVLSAQGGLSKLGLADTREQLVGDAFTPMFR